MEHRAGGAFILLPLLAGRPGPYDLPRRPLGASSTTRAPSSMRAGGSDQVRPPRAGSDNKHATSANFQAVSRSLRAAGGLARLSVREKP